VLREELYEDESFPRRELAALVASKVPRHAVITQCAYYNHEKK
jgi:hypothetical protein